jgi:hypothetical protein
MRVLAAAVVAAAFAAAGSQAAVPGVPSIYINYNPDCTFTMSVDGGITVSPNATIPPGPYQLLVSMPNPGSGYSCGTPTFTFTGPGVSAQTAFAGQQLQATTVLPALQPSSTYVAEDANVPAATLHTITTAASGSSSSLLASGTSPATTGSNTQPDIVGSAVAKSPARLVASVGTAGKATLKLGGHLVTTLKAGRYEIEPATAKGTHLVFSGNGRKITLTKAEPITFTAGRWTFSAGRGAAFGFRVQ